MLYRVMMSILTLLGSALCACKPLTKSTAPKIDYSIEKSKTGLYDTLHATVNGRTYPLIDQSEKLCLQIVE